MQKRIIDALQAVCVKGSCVLSRVRFSAVVVPPPAAVARPG
jgi:hypothetical protein